MKEPCMTCNKNLDLEIYHDKPEKCYFHTGQLKSVEKKVPNDLQMLNRIGRIEETIERWSSVMENKVMEEKKPKQVYSSFDMVPEFKPSQVFQQSDSTQFVSDYTNDRITNHINMVHDSLSARLERIENMIRVNTKLDKNLFGYKASNSMINQFFDYQTDKESSLDFRQKIGSEFYRESTYSRPISSGESSMNYYIKHYRPALSLAKSLEVPSSLNQSTNSMSTLTSEDRIFESLDHLDPSDYFVVKKPSDSIKKVKSETNSLTLKRKRGRPKKCTADSI